MSKITLEEFSGILRELFSIEVPLDESTDLALYIRDSIDLGELMAVVKERHGVVPSDVSLFKVHSRLGAVLRIFNHELS